MAKQQYNAEGNFYYSRKYENELFYGYDYKDVFYKLGSEETELSMDGWLRQTYDPDLGFAFIIPVAGLTFIENGKTFIDTLVCIAPITEIKRITKSGSFQDYICNLLPEHNTDFKNGLYDNNRLKLFLIPDWYRFA